MKSKLLMSTLVVAALVGAPAIAMAQSEQAAPPAEKSMGAKTTKHHKLKIARAHFRHGTTTGMSSTRARPGGESVARKPAGE